METGIILCEGDMVKFHAPEIFSDAKREYKNPGIVMEVLESQDLFGVPSPRAHVYWADGRTTNEHFCYLKKISSSNFDRNR